MTPDRAPTREEQHKAIVLGLLAAKHQQPVSSCRFPADGQWNTAMRQSWLDGYADTAAFE